MLTLAAGAAARWALIDWKKLLLKGLPYFIGVAAVLGLGWYIYHLGSQSGAAKVEAAWTEEKLANEKALNKLRGDMAARETVHRQQSQRISDDLAEANQKHARTVATLDAQFAQRLRNSEQRAAYYQHLSGSGATEQEYLASHAARLDRSLEEGRRLVQEFGATLEQRDAQIRALGQQILTDRSLIGEKDGRNPDSTE